MAEASDRAVCNIGHRVGNKPKAKEAAKMKTTSSNDKYLIYSHDYLNI